ncbi:MAG: hypothetical protein J2P54_06065 [Bradyrhizobiaceae bacterium]|nr:hypothetical protein [Bradyrhizobiaceae bacterium]
MNENPLAAQGQHGWEHHAFHRLPHREIGLRAVAAAVLYQGGHVERASHELAAPPSPVTPSSDHET